MNFGVLQSGPVFSMGKPVKVSPKGNLYKISITHPSTDNQPARSYEVWATKEAVQNHFGTSNGEPKVYQLRRFAKRVYEDRLRVSNHQPNEKATLVSSTQKFHGDPSQWPHTIVDPEIKI